eukprot:5052262-Amphidinium_carterae.1
MNFSKCLPPSAKIQLFGISRCMAFFFFRVIVGNLDVGGEASSCTSTLLFPHRSTRTARTPNPLFTKDGCQPNPEAGLRCSAETGLTVLHAL